MDDVSFWLCLGGSMFPAESYTRLLFSDDDDNNYARIDSFCSDYSF